MTIKFNFYDIYGFALPGFLLLALLWLPFGLVENKWPDIEFSSALIGVILAYIAGHVLQQVAQHALPSNFGEEYYASSKFLDKVDRAFSVEFKKRLAEQIKTTFQIPISPEVSLTSPADNPPGTILKDVDRARRDAFFLCRSALIKSKTVIYPEQFEGLYALMRGLCAAFAIAVANYFGWANSTALRGRWSAVLALFAMIVGLVAATFVTRNKSKKRAALVMAVSVLVAAFSAGHYLGQLRVVTFQHRNLFIAAAVFSFFAAERCYAGYRGFAEEFAKAVYRDFSNYEKPAAGGAGGAANAPDREDD